MEQRHFKCRKTNFKVAKIAEIVLKYPIINCGKHFLKRVYKEIVKTKVSKNSTFREMVGWFLYFFFLLSKDNPF